MKMILVSLSILLCAIALPALGALTDADLDKIRLIVNEAERRIQEELKPIKADIATLKTDGAVIKTEVTNLKGTVNKDFDAIQKNFDRQNNIIIACIGIPLAILAIGATVWGILAHRRSGKDRALERQIETLTQEIEATKATAHCKPLTNTVFGKARAHGPSRQK